MKRMARMRRMQMATARVCEMVAVSVVMYIRQEWVIVRRVRFSGGGVAGRFDCCGRRCRRSVMPLAAWCRGLRAGPEASAHYLLEFRFYFPRISSS